MLFPRYVQIGPFKHQIRWGAKAIKAFEKEHGPLFGFYDADTQTLHIKKAGIHHDQAADTLLHELLHAIFHVGRTGLTEGAEERTISAITPVLLDVLRRNPHITSFLTSPTE